MKPKECERSFSGSKPDKKMIEEKRQYELNFIDVWQH